MDIELERIAINDAEKLWKLQVDAFQDLYNKYQDTETNPATEPIEKMYIQYTFSSEKMLKCHI